MATVERSQVYICDEPGCGKTFADVMAFRGHQGSHRNKGEYICEVCAANGVRFVTSLPQGLGAHMRAKHKMTGVSKSATAKRNTAKAKEPTRATDVPVVAQKDAPKEFFTVQVPQGVTRMGEEAPPVYLVPPAAAVPPTPPLSEGVVTTNGTDPIEKEIREAFAPLVTRYQSLQARQVELMTEMESNSHDLDELWKVLGLGVDLSVELTPPPMQLGVQVAFQKKVSDSLRERGEEWLSVRKNSFTGTDMARALGVAPSTATNLIVELRDEGKVRLVGKRGRAKTYLSTIGAR